MRNAIRPRGGRWRVERGGTGSPMDITRTGKPDKARTSPRYPTIFTDVCSIGLRQRAASRRFGEGPDRSLRGDPGRLPPPP